MMPNISIKLTCKRALLKYFHKRRCSTLSLTFPVEAKLKDGSPVQLVLAYQHVYPCGHFLTSHLAMDRSRESRR